MLLGSTILEVAIGMVFVYLLMSLLCSALGELINSLFRFRGRDLEKGIKRLLDDSPVPGSGGGFLSRFTGKSDEKASPPSGQPMKLSESFFKHPLIKPLFEGRKPSYIPARTFSLALWNMATEEAKQVLNSSPPMASPPTVGDVTRSVEKDLTILRATLDSMKGLMPEELRRSLLIHMDEAGDDFDKARANVEKWYDDAMDRVSGGFRRRAQYILLGLGFILAFAMNVDSFNIFRALWTHDDLRKTVVAAAEKYVEQPQPTPTAASSTTPKATPSSTPKATPTSTPTPTAAANAGATPVPTPTPDATPTESPTPTADEQFQAARERISKVKGEINELGLPIGWDCTLPNFLAKATGAGSDGNANANRNANANANKGSNANANANANTNAGATPTPGADALAAGTNWWGGKCEELSPSNPRGAPSGLGWIFKALGLFLTALAVSQGAPFWFDILNKFIVIRSTVKPREKSRTEGTKDKRDKGGEDEGEGNDTNSPPK
jgi:outer membrane biosynthesis protein TonB